MTRLQLGGWVKWGEVRARVVGLHEAPSAVLELGDGGDERWITVAQHLLTPAPAPLPEDPGAVIRWKDAAYLPHLAILDPGPQHLGWFADDENGDGRWMTAEQLQERLGGVEWIRLVPRAEP